MRLGLMVHSPTVDPSLMWILVVYRRTINHSDDTGNVTVAHCGWLEHFARDPLSDPILPDQAI
jgi:hypothetical protein